MIQTAKSQYTLENLGCADCAAKMEEKINKLEEIKEASINFVTKTLFIEAKSSIDEQKLKEKLNEIILKIEPYVVIQEKTQANYYNNRSLVPINKPFYKKLNLDVIKIAVAIFLFAIALIFVKNSMLEMFLYIFSYVIAGHRVILRAVRNTLSGQFFDENFLMTIATLGAFAIGEYPEAVAVMLFYLVGEYFQDMAVARSRKSIAELMNIRPDYANLKRADNIEKVSPEAVQVNDIIIVKPGEKVPLDGFVISGDSFIDTSNITGEAVPRRVTLGDEVLGGFINTSGLLTIKVTKIYKESTVAKILNLVENASSKKAPTESFITKFARYYTPFIVGAAVLVAIIPPLLLSGATFSDWIYRALIFLVISCPCALVISIPLGFFGGIGGASKNGILVKGGNYLEALNYVDTVVFDKTGTLTRGVFKVTKIAPAENYSADELLEYAVKAEAYSSHPIATSIIREYGKQVIGDKVASYNELPGLGIEASFSGEEIIVGNHKLMLKRKIYYTEADEIGTVIHLAVNNDYVGYIVVADELKEDSSYAISALKRLGIKKTIMLTGDREEIGKKIAAKLGIDEVFTELLPDQKVDKLEVIMKLKSPQKKVIYVGDGVNDTPALARADIGIAMGGLGSDAVIEVADIVLMTDEPTKIASAIAIAKKTKQIVWQNIIFAFGVKLIVLLLGIFGLATMWEAVFADVGVALLAVLNAMRVLNSNYKDNYCLFGDNNLQ